MEERIMEETVLDVLQPYELSLIHITAIVILSLFFCNSLPVLAEEQFPINCGLFEYNHVM